MSNPATSGVDIEAASRLRAEWEHVKSALQGSSASEVEDPLGQDGTLTVKLNSFRHNGAGEVIFLKGTPPADHRYTRFRTWGATGSEFIEKSSYLVKESGYTEFHKKRAEPGENVVVVHEMDGEDQAWAQTLA